MGGSSVVGEIIVHAPDVDFLFQQPVANAEMRTWVSLDVSLLIRFFAEE